MEAIKDPQTGILSAKYQLLEMARLNSVLRKQGIADKGVRYRICSDYFFPHGMLLDSDGDPFPWQGKQLHPVLCFAERYPRSRDDEKSGQLRKLYLEDHANLYWQTEVSLRLLFGEMNEDASGLEKELGQTL